MTPFATLVLAASLVQAAPSSADHGSIGGLAAAYHNTLLSVYPDGRKAKLWLNADHTYTAEGRRHDRSAGHWKLKSGQICMTQSKPFAVPFFTYCTDLHAGGVGTSWQAKAPTGETIKVTLIRGRPAPAEPS